MNDIPQITQTHRRPTYEWLTAARAFFVTWIILRHMSADGGMAAWVRQIIPSINVFDIPTTFFFLISGLMFSTGRDMGPDWGSVRSFWRSRLARLAPVYILSVIISAPIGWKAAGGDPLLFAFSGLAEITFFQGFIPGLVEWNMTGWFMSSIAICYLSYPFLVRLIQAAGTQKLVAVFVCCAAYSILAAVLCSHVLDTADQAQHVRRIPVLSIPMFVMGIIMGTLMKRTRRALLAKVSIFIAILGILAAIFFVKNYIYLFIGAALWAPVVIGLVVLPISAPKALVWMGERAFILYALHWPLYVYFKGVYSRLLPTWPVDSALATLVFLCGLLYVAEKVRVYLEAPMQELLAAAKSR